MRLLNLSIFAILLAQVVRAQAAGNVPGGGRIDVLHTLDSLLAEEDTDHDLRLSVHDSAAPGTGRGDKIFTVVTLDGERHRITGTYLLANLLEELTLARDSGETTLELSRIYEDPADRVSRQIRERYWDGLTRRIDERGLERVLKDEKVGASGGGQYLYVPADDSAALAYYREIASRHPAWNLSVVPLPRGNRAGTVDSRHGLLTLGVRAGVSGAVEGIPFVVPGGRFNEMYGWDSYFIVRGLLLDGRVELAKGIVDNFVYEIAHYGSVLNANRTYYLTRSQPPFLTSMALAVAERLPEDAGKTAWLRGVVEAAITEYRNVWTNDLHITPTGLSRYYDAGSGVPPEVEPGAFTAVFASYAQSLGIDAEVLEREYRAGTRRVPELDTFFIHDRCMRESGHDTSYRLEGCCADLATVDLNSLLFRMESDIADLIGSKFGGALRMPDGRVERSLEWVARAARRKELVNRYCWDPRKGIFFDYDLKHGAMTSFVSATTFYPLWAGLATPEQASSLVQHALPLLEMAGGISGSTEESRGPVSDGRPLRQWDYPFGWAPHQMIVWDALHRFGFDAEARRTAYRWLYTIAKNAADYNGTITEKYNVVTRSHDVFAEYGNVGSSFAYITREGFGWTNASFQAGFSILSPELRKNLNKLTPPESIFH